MPFRWVLTYIPLVRLIEIFSQKTSLCYVFVVPSLRLIKIRLNPSSAVMLPLSDRVVVAYSGLSTLYVCRSATCVQILHDYGLPSVLLPHYHP